MSFAPVWPGPCLTVPVTVDCLLVGDPDRSGTTWATTAVNYANLNAALPALPQPFTAKTTAPLTGAHLMWTVPFTLRSGKQVQSGPDAGSLTFPNVPNRWLVMRTYYGPAYSAQSSGPPPPPVLVASVIQSDLLTAPPNGVQPGMSQYPVTPQAGARMQPMQIGGAFALSAWTGPVGAAPPFLTAMGPAEVSWSVIYDDVQNVFAFYDPLTDANAGLGTYGYSVIGWYADPGTDPLQGLPVAGVQQWIDELANRFAWSVAPTGDLPAVTAGEAAWAAWQQAHGLTPGGAALPAQLQQAMTQWLAWWEQHGVVGPQPDLPTQLLCYGMVASVPWSGPGTVYGSGAPNKSPSGEVVYPTVAVGNSAVEATAAWLADAYVSSQHGSPITTAEIERAIEAFQRGFLLELYSDPVAAEAKLHAAEFATNTIGTQWIVVRPADDASQSVVSSTAGQTTIPLDDAQTQALTALNAAQSARDAAAANLVSRQSELFALLYKNLKQIFRTLTPATQNLVTAAYAAVTAQIDADQAALTVLDDAIGTAKNALSAMLVATKDTPGYVLLSVNAPPATAPNDPVVMLAGVGTDTKFAPPGTYGDGATLSCRFTGQTVTGIAVTVGTTPVTLLAADVLAPVTVFPQGQPIPKEAQDMWLELLFLDPGAAPFLAATALAKAGAAVTPAAVAALAATITQQQLAPWPVSQTGGLSRQAVAAATGLQGVLPAPDAITFHNGKQPWTPVALDWQVAWYASATAPSGQLQTWSLDATDYTWTGASPPAPALPPACASVPSPVAQPLTFQGRTPLNPKIAADIGAALAQFAAADDPNYAVLPQYVRDALDGAAVILGRFDVMTQALSGLTQQLLQRVIAASADSTDPATVKRLGDAPIRFVPQPGNDDGCLHPFFPVRAGHFVLTNVWVIDSFGQILRGVDPSSGRVLPIRAQSVKTHPDGTDPNHDPNAPFVELPPRIAQTARVDLRLLDADDDTILTNSSDATSPICGWVVPNHLDASLMVYDAGGITRGAIIKIATDLQSSGLDTGLRWDAPPGVDAPLGAPPNLSNAHLQGFVTALLRRGLTEGAAPLDTLLDHIDSALFVNTPLGPPDRNVSALLGAPLAVVRAQVVFELAGLPAFDQSWAATGTYYVGSNPPPAPLLSVPFGMRIGDMGFGTNGVMGYFVGGDYDTFYAAYGAGGQTAGVLRAIRGGIRPPGGLALHLAQTASHALAGASNYVVTGHLVPLMPNGVPVYVTLLVDPRGMIPVVSGIAPVVTVTLAPGPVSAALRAMTASFRVGPLLVDPRAIGMPLPSEVRGDWKWVARTDVTSWSDPLAVKQQNAVATIPATPPRLSEGWLTLSAMFDPKPPQT